MAKYIDAHALLEENKNAEFYSLIPDICEAVDALIKKQPTADVKEVVRGEWVKPYVLFSDRICSCCGYKTTVGCIKNFCTNCGADMRNTK